MRRAPWYERLFLEPAAEISAAESVTTFRLSPTACKYRATISLNGARSGPAISTIPVRGFPKTLSRVRLAFDVSR
jgi:hypothetical protein